MGSSFVHLHNHTDASALDGAAKPLPLAERAIQLDMPAVAITDHGTLSGLYDFYQACTKTGIKPILGLESYFMPIDYPRTHTEPIRIANGKDDDISGRGSYTHVTMWAENNTGLQNLYAMSTGSYETGFYQKPRIDIELLSQHSEGIIATTGCPSGEVQTLLRLGRYDEARRVAGTFQDILGRENYFLELMDHGLEVEARAREGLMRLAKDLNIPLVGTNDLHYVYREDATMHEAFLCVQSGSNMQNPNRFKFDGNAFYLRSAEEMREVFKELPEACDNTLLIAERCNITIEPQDGLMPVYPTDSGRSSIQEFSIAIRDGLSKRLGVPADEVPQEYKNRALYEFEIIKQMNFPDYFLITADFINWAKENGILVGPARGCLSGDTQVLTPTGTKNIKDVVVGDEVFDHTGAIVVVPQTFEYDCDEELIEIKAFYGGRGNKMTADHKVLVSKANRETDSRRLAQGYRYLPDVFEPEWIRADEVEVGDLVVTPRLQLPCSTSGWRFEPVAIHRSAERSTLSSRSIASAAGCSSAAVKRFMNKGGEVAGATAIRIRDHLSDLGATAQDCLDVRTNKIVASTDFLPATYGAGQLFGMFISNGWLRTDGAPTVGFAQRRSEDTGYYPGLVESLFGLKPSFLDHASKDLRQYSILHKGIYSLFRDLFPDYQQTAHTKYIPVELLSTPEEFRLGLLHGLWYGDGYNGNQTVYSTVSPRLANDVALLLGSLGLPFGIKSHTRADSRPGFACDSRTEYKVTTAHNFDTESMHSGGVGFDGSFTYYRVREVNRVPAEGKVYDFTVPGNHSYCTDSYVVHNSAGGSLVAWAMGITEIDPMRHGLLFERFLNPERISMPDIDVDFDDRRRGEVIQYVRDKYGEDKVANIGTVSVIKAKSAMKDAARALGVEYHIAEAMTKAYPEDIMGVSMPLIGVEDERHPRHKEAGKFRELLESSIDTQKVFELAKEFEGLRRGMGQHAAGVIMSSEPIANIVPLMRSKKDGPLMTAFDYPTCETLGLLKMDFLGLSNLGTIDEALKSIKANGGEVNLDHLINTLDDKDTYKLLASGETLGVFQLDSPPMRALLRKMQPDTFDDISAVLALYRPGPMAANAHNDYADYKNNRKPITPIHPELKEPLADVLDETYSLIVYQEQIQRVAQIVAGYSLGQADLLRRAMGKKKKEILDKEYVPFREGMKKNGYSDEAIKKLWDVLVPFASYAFNKCVVGSTLIRLGSGNQYAPKEMPIEQLYERIHGAPAKFGANACAFCGNANHPKPMQMTESGHLRCEKCRSYQDKFHNPDRGLSALALDSDGRIRAKRIKDVHYSGTRPVYTMTLSNGRSITSTKNHRHMTESGWKELGDIAAGDQIMVLGKPSENACKPGEFRLTRVEASYAGAKLPNSERNGKNSLGYRTGAYIAFREWTETQEWKCTVKGCGKTKENGDRIERAHLDGDRTNNDPSNLQMMCASHHKAYDYKHNKRTRRGQAGHSAEYATVVSIKYAGKQEVYDLEMDDPGHNWVGNGLVTHNSHSAGYGLISYITAFLKKHYPVEYMAALLTTNENDKDKVAVYLSEARRLGINIAQPDINKSNLHYTPVAGKVRIGLSSIRNIGVDKAQSIIDERERGGEFTSFANFLSRMSGKALNSRAIDSLIRAGAFDGFGYARAALAGALVANKPYAEGVRWLSSRIVKTAEREAQGKKPTPARLPELDESKEYVTDAAPITVHSDTLGDIVSSLDVLIPVMPEWPASHIAKIERDMLGRYITVHPLDGKESALKAAAQQTITELKTDEDLEDDSLIRVAGIVTSVSEKTTRRGDKMGVFVLSDRDGEIECVAFPRVWAKNSAKCCVDTIVKITGRAQFRDAGMNVLVDQVELI